MNVEEKKDPVEGKTTRKLECMPSFNFQVIYIFCSCSIIVLPFLVFFFTNTAPIHTYRFL